MLRIPDTTEFDSSNLHSGLYNPREKKLFIRFQSGDRIYMYEDVPMKVWTELKNADSAGQYFNRSIRGEYNTEELS